MKSGLLLLLFSIISYGATQQGENLDDLITKIFQKPNETPGTPQDTGPRNPDLPVSLQQSPGGDGGGSGTGNCDCVPYYLCKNNTIVTDGYGVINIRDISIDNVPCDYPSVWCNMEDKLTEPITPPPDVTRSGCGIRNPDGIGFGIREDRYNKAQFGEFPWMVAVLHEEGVERKLLIYQCGASLIHPQVVLTSARCVIGKDKQFKIRAGEWDTQTKSELYAHQDRDVKTVIIHPEYYAGALFNDIALLILETPLKTVENVEPVCLPTQGQLVEHTRCFASGWGKDVFGKEGKYQVIFKKIELPIVARDVCQESLRTTRLGKHFKLHESFICAGGEVGKYTTCKGDGGSPLVCPIPGHPGRYFQAGIVSWGIDCGENHVPGVYANVAQFANWIDQQLAAHNLEKSYYTY